MLNLILILSTYVLLPFSLAFIWWHFHLKRRFLTYIITLVLIFLYPFLLLAIDEYKHPDTDQIKCLMPQYVLVMGNLLFFLPLSLLFQWLFNAVFRPVQFQKV